MEIELVETDVLCVGGGIAGLMAAIRARELGVQVTIAEKGVTKSSGAGRAGNDHFWCYIPEVHGSDMGAFVQECMLTQKGPALARLSPIVVKTWLENSYDVVKLWDSWGIPMKHNGKWRFAGHSFPGRVMTHLKYKGKNQKRVLTEKALGMGVRIRDRVMIFELLGGPEAVTGAIGIDTREDKLLGFRAKSVFLGTGDLARMYPALLPGLLLDSAFYFTLTGDGRAMAYRLGAELVNMEMIGRHAGIKNYRRGGQQTWAGVCRDPHGKPVGKYLNRPDIRYGDMVIEVDKQMLEKYMKTGRGPVYMDCTGLSKEDYKLMMEDLEHEGNQSLLAHLKEEGIDVKKNSVEFTTYEVSCSGKIVNNEKAESSVPGLYVGGDEATKDISGAAVFGWIGGENAAAHSAKTPSLRPERERHTIEGIKSFIDSFQRRNQGPDWKDANLALQYTMADYAGLVRSETLLVAGLAHLRRLKEKVHKTLQAKNRWELSRCLEVINLYDLGELVFLAALERKESRGLHNRTDYPYTDPLLNDKLLFIKRVDGKPAIEWRGIKRDR